MSWSEELASRNRSAVGIGEVSDDDTTVRQGEDL
jgi:hypothetical protein